MKTANDLMKKTYSYKYLMPGLILFAGLFVIPSLGSLYYAFTLYDGFKVYGFAGLENFKQIFTDLNNNICFKNTILFAIVSVTFRMLLGLALALFVNRDLVTKNYLRSIFFFPVILSSVAVGVAFTSILNPEVGLLNTVLRHIGLGRFAAGWLTDPDIVIFSCAAVDVWKSMGFAMALFLAGLQNIPKELYESANIDGASSWEKFKNVTIPFLMPIIKINFVFAVIGGLKVLDAVYVLTAGGPGSASQVISSVVLRAFSQGRYGEATAANLILFVGVLIIVVLSNKLISKKEIEV